MMQRKLKHIYRFISVFFIWFALMVIIRWSIQNSNVPNHMFQCNHVSWPFKPNSINRYIARFANIHIFGKFTYGACHQSIAEFHGMQRFGHDQIDFIMFSRTIDATEQFLFESETVRPSIRLDECQSAVW